MGEKSKRQKEVRDPSVHRAFNEIVDSRWKIVRVLGEGGFGAVYEVKDVKADPETENCAMKVIFLFFLFKIIFDFFRSNP